MLSSLCFRCSNAFDRSSRSRLLVTFAFIAFCLRTSLGSSVQCSRSNGSPIADRNKWLSSDAYTGVVVNCRSRGFTRVPTLIPNDMKQLDLSENNIATIGQKDFAKFTKLRILVLSSSSVTTLRTDCFRQLANLEQLVLNDNNITSFPPGVFNGLHSLRILTMSGLPLTSYPAEFVAHTPELRVLSLSAIGDATIPTEYARLSRLEVLDFYEDPRVRLTKITAAMFDNIRNSNITTLTFRVMTKLQNLETEAFSNLPNLRGLVLSCNRMLQYSVTMTSLATTTNTSIDTVVLDGMHGQLSLNSGIFRQTDFCFPFWRSMKRLSIKSVHLSVFDFTHAGCLSNLREFVLGYNAIWFAIPSHPNLPLIFPNIRTIRLSHIGSSDEDFRRSCCSGRKHCLLDVDLYFPARPPLLPKSTSLTTNDTAPCSEPLSVIPASLEFLHLAEFGSLTPRTINVYACLSHVQLRFLNLSLNTFTKVLCSGCRLLGKSRLEILDMSHGALQEITPEFMHSFPYLRFLNISHNSLGETRADFRSTFSHLRLLQDLNLSNNKLCRINPRAFEHCTSLKRLTLADNELTRIDIYMNHMRTLEYIDLSGNRLISLSDTFMSTLDQQFNVRSLSINIQREVFACNCESVSFIRWTRVTSVQIVGRERLTCWYGESKATPLSSIELGRDVAGCDVSIADNNSWLPSIVLSILAIVIFTYIVVLLMRYQRWYIKYHLTLCWLRGGGSTSGRQKKQYDAMVTYFLHASNARDQMDGVARISRWVCTRLLPRAENDWGLRFYVGDRDDIAGASKMHNFVRGFQSSDKVVVCLTREFIDDSDCMNYLATALDSSKPLSKYIFVLFDHIQPTSVPRRLRQLLLPDSPCVMLRCGDINDHDDGEADGTFWRRMRYALTCDPDQERCRRHFDVISLLIPCQKHTEDSH